MLPEPYSGTIGNQISLDAVDRAILLQIRQSGRLTNVELARRVGLTPPTCLRRVRRLERAGVIGGYRARIDPVALGRAFEAVIAVEIRTTDQATVEEFETTVASYDEVVDFRRMFGRPDHIIRVAVADQAAYEKFLMTKLMGLPAIVRAESQLTMKKIKSEG